MSGGGPIGEMSREMRLKLDKRIHNQRVVLRENWMILDMRATFRPWLFHKRWTSLVTSSYQERNAAIQRAEAAEAAITTADRTGYERGVREAAEIAKTLPIGGGTLSGWINTNESPAGAYRRHIAAAILALLEANMTEIDDRTENAAHSGGRSTQV